MADADGDDGTLELEQSTQHLKDFKLAIEFKYLVRYSQEARNFGRSELTSISVLRSLR